MEDQALKNRVFIFIRKNLFVVILASLGMIFFVYGLIGLSIPASKTDDIVIETSGEQKSIETITVDVEGAVVKPGVYSINSNSRVKDALIAASGLGSEADRDWVAKSLNMAAKITDGSKIYIPKLGESTSVQITDSGISGNTTIVNINSANSQELDGLPGVGPITAEKIINNRPYSSINDLLARKAVSEKIFNQIKDKITTN
jgi:competence protein ComEA